MSLTVLFMLLFGLFLASCRVFGKWLGWGSNGTPAISTVEAPFLGQNVLARAYSQPLQSLGASSPQRLNTWATRLFIAIVLQCAALFMVSQFPGIQSPFWLGIALQGFTYGSAALFYASGGDEPTGY
jgi:hypothetical protein